MPFLLAAAGVLYFLLLWVSFSALKRRRLLQDLPTSKTTGVFIGLVELKGITESESPLTGYLSEKLCVWYSYTISEHWQRTVTEHYTDKDGKLQTRMKTESGWTTVASGGESGLFYLQDDEGIIRIDPKGAEIHHQTVFSHHCSSSDPLYYGKGPAGRIAHSTGKRSFTETAVPLYHPVYVVGKSRVRDDCAAAEIAADKDAKVFMISTSTEEEHLSSGFWKFWICGVLFTVIPVGLAISAVQRADMLPLLLVPAAAGCAAGLVWGGGVLYIVYNSLIELKNRLTMAAANIDVELKRRFDLIPQLVGVIEGLQKHEQNVLTAMSVLRSQTATDGAGTLKGCAGQLTTLIENYPELKANELFMNLHRNLTETEQRIALARNYYNDVIKTYNNRRERFPESIAASLACLKPVELFVAEDFERAAVDVHLSGGLAPAAIPVYNGRSSG